MKITAGNLKGRVIPVRHSPKTALRPTSDKMRQAIFNFLCHNPSVLDVLPTLDGVSVLDAFSGTGALGLEAISRGAAHVTFFDTDPKAVADLKKLSADFSVSEYVTIYKMSALKPVSADQSVSLIFLDPPYGQNLLMPAVHALQGAGWADADTLFVCEVERNCREIPIRPLVDKAYGDSRLIIGQI